nr:MAG TPA: hypothetical protein [Caudoviricetes sp.]
MTLQNPKPNIKFVSKRHRLCPGGVYRLGHGFFRLQRSAMVRIIHTA